MSKDLVIKDGKVNVPINNSPKVYGKFRVGKESIASNGLKMKIISYRSAQDIDIKFEDGTIVKNKRYQDFQKGTIKNPSVKNKSLMSDRVGKITTARNGMKMQVVGYRSANDIDIMFEDGYIVRNKSYANFVKGLIKHPKNKF